MAQTNPFDQFDSSPTITTRRDPLAVRRDDRADRADARASDASDRAARAAERSAANDAVRIQLDKIRLAREAAQGGGPAPSRIPATALSGIQENLRNLRQLDHALSSLDPRTGRPNSIGPGTGFFGNTVTQFNDPQGTTTRARVGEVGAVKIHDLSGAAVSASEAPRFQPFVPTVTDRPEVARDKLQNFRQNLIDTIREQEVAYSPANGYLPYRTSQGSLTDYLAHSNRQTAPSQIDPVALDDGQRRDAVGVATGATRREQVPEANAIVDAGIRAGHSVEQTNAALRAKGLAEIQPDNAANYTGAQDYLRQHPNYKGSFSDATREVPTTAMQRAAASPLVAAAAGVGDAMTLGRGDRVLNAIGGPEAVKARALLARANPMATLAGNVVGGAGAAGALEAGIGASGLRALPGFVGAAARSPVAADVAYGAATGSSADNPLLGALEGGALGYGGARLGQAVTSGVRGVTDPAVQALRARGVPLTFGQAVGQSGIAGRGVKMVEDALSSVPGVNSVLAARRREGIQGFNRAALNEAAAPLANQTTPLNVGITGTGPEGVEALRMARTAGYDNAVNGRFASVDPQYTADYQGALTTARAIPNTGPAVASEIDAAAPGYFAAGNISGSNAQAAIRELQGIRRARVNDPLGHRTGQSVRQAEDAMRGLFDRQVPGFTNDLARANEVQTGLKTIEAAGSQAANLEDGLFTPAQLNRASVQSANRLTGGGATRNRPFYDLAEAGQSVLPSKVPDSGTAGRLAVQGALLGTGGTASYVTGDSRPLTAAAALGLLQTQAAQRMLVASVLNRGARSNATADFLERYGVARSLGAGGAVATLPR